MKVWVDDIRYPPAAGWVWAKSSEQAIHVLRNADEPIEILSLDHDLGKTLVRRGNCRCGEVNKENVLGHADGCRYFVDSVYDEDTTRPVVIWMIENDCWPENIIVHSANPVGVEWLEGMIERYRT